MIINTAVPMDQYHFVIKAWDRFNNYAFKNVSVFVCGNETLIEQPHQTKFIIHWMS